MSLPVDIFCSRAKFAPHLLLFLPLLVGCANPGPPRPPSLHLPQIVSDLSAERIGSEVRLHWTTSDKTTDGISMIGPLSAQICRSSSPPACLPVITTPVKPGASEAIDSLPPALNADPQVLLEYRVTTLNNRQHSAGPSAPAFAAAGSAPPAVTGIRVEAAEQGAMLRWEPKDAVDMIELDRLHVVATTAPARQSRQKEATEMHFRAAKTNDGSSPFRADAGGSLDATAHRGETYTYTAQRVRPVTLKGHALEIRSVLSPVVTVVMRDTFPPRPPTGLEAVLAGQNGSSPAIDLSWRPNTEPDLAGYRVYRQELGPDGVAIGTRLQLTPALIPEPGFHDAAVAAGHAYSYSITAIDGSGNESVSGVSTKQDIPLP